MANDIFINMEREVFMGNVLDVGFDNYGIVYNVCKEYDYDINIEYLNGCDEKKYIENNYYDSCVIMFSLKNILFKANKKKIIKEIYSYLKDDGYIYIWDVDKGYKNTVNTKVKIAIPEQKIKEITIKDYNVFQDNSKESIVKLLKPYFDIIDLKCSNNIYYIKARKKKVSDKEKKEDKKSKENNLKVLSSSLKKYLNM